MYGIINRKLSIPTIFTELKTDLSKKEKPAPPPKPKIVPVVQKPSHDVVAMEQLILVLR